MTLRSTLALLVLASAGCDELPPGDWSSPWFWGATFLAKYAAHLEIDELEPGPPPQGEPRTVLLITGVTIPARWFDPIVARLERDGFRPVVYEPPDLLSGSLFENAEELGRVIEQVRSESGQDRIDILAECTGGVIARHYIQSLGGDRYVSRLVTFISPQNGVAAAPLAAKLVGWPALHDLSPGSAFLRAVQAVPLPPTVAVTSIYSCTDEYIQPYQTSIIPGATNLGICDRFVGHFEFFYDPDLYLLMHAALVAPAPELPSARDDADTVEMEPAPAGCAAGGGPGAPAGALMVLAALLMRRRQPAIAEMRASAVRKVRSSTSSSGE